ncbi:MAG: hypothetical protein A2Z21_07000 [Candidatus Fraserbacteria bacterium RBG_16_55_9]|uniref:Uncharacterized protein n=1 Tax=Fraserbacteria sp. (strain RBG_16_55_9) TaxID=1817864 RepID=A0A1F5UQL0_FRAXR|nr:MAG: hypothetical protein A2Z21_07000 [Candidatus Fraserbacteria bacterium RBG_16_55_9]
MSKRSGNAAVIIAVLIACTISLSNGLAPSALAQSISLGPKVGIATGEFSVFTELVVMPNFSASLSSGLLSSALTVTGWVTMYWPKSLKFLPTYAIPYAAVGLRVLTSNAGAQSDLILLGGLRLLLPPNTLPSPVRGVSLMAELALLIGFPNFDRIGLDARVSLSLSF